MLSWLRTVPRPSRVRQFWVILECKFYLVREREELSWVETEVCQIDKVSASLPASSDPKGAPPTRIDPLGRRPVEHLSHVITSIVTLLSAAVRNPPVIHSIYYVE